MRWSMGAGALALAGCVSASGQIASELTRFGLDPSRATCLGERLAADLSADQLRQLAAAARAYGRNDPDPGRLTAADLGRAAAQIDDPAVPLTLGRAAIGCGIRVSDVF